MASHFSFYLRYFKALLVILIASTLLSGCKSTPDALDVSNESLLVSFEKACEVASVDELTADDAEPLARWGGKIKRVKTNGIDMLVEITYYTDENADRPRREPGSDGEFIALMQGYTDKDGFNTGRLITVVGDVVAASDETQSPPIILTKAVHLWTDIRFAKNNDPAALLAISDKESYQQNLPDHTSSTDSSNKVRKYNTAFEDSSDNFRYQTIQGKGNSRSIILEPSGS